MPVRATSTGCRLAVRIAPCSSRNGVLGAHDGALKIALPAPPVDGEANAALIWDADSAAAPLRLRADSMQRRMEREAYGEHISVLGQHRYEILPLTVAAAAGAKKVGLPVIRKASDRDRARVAERGAHGLPNDRRRAGVRLDGRSAEKGRRRVPRSSSNSVSLAGHLAGQWSWSR